MKMTNVSRLVIVLGFLFWTAGISTTGYSQPPLPYTHYEIVNVEVQGKLEVGEPVTIVVTIQDMSNVSSSSGTYEIYINRTPVDYGTIYLSSGDSTTVRYTHYFDAPGTYSIDIETCSELGSCPDDIASGTISIKDSSTPPLPPPPPLPPQPPSNQPPWATIAAPTEVKVGETFWVEIIDYGDDQPNPLVFEYDFGDGRRVRSPGAEQHSYSSPGTYTIRGRVCDPQGACSDTNSVTIRVRESSLPPPPSNHPPSVTLSCYPLNLTPNDTLSCEASASDPNGDPLTYEWFLNEQKLTKISPSSNRVYWDKPQPGFYTLKVVVSDNRGGTSQSSVSFTVQETQQNRPPVIQSIEYAPSNPVAGQLVRFWASVYDENGWIVAYEWDFGSLPFQVEEQPEYAWQNPGTYRVCLTVYDNDGASARKCRDITVQAARTLLPPQANFTFSPSSPKVGETVYFRDRSTDPDNGRIIRWLWSFGNEQFSYESNPSYTYQQEGRYTVCLAVFDNDDLSDQKCIDITVQPDDRLTKQPPVPRFTMTAPNGQTAQENQTLTLTVPRGGKVSINFAASNSYDPDGGGIRSYEWWINGTFVSQSSQFSFELGANTPGHLIQLKVTDDEGQTSEVGATVIITEQQTLSANPTLRVEGSTSSTKQQGQTFNLSGGGYSPNGSVRVFVLKDDKIIDLFQRQADRNGNISWSWPTDCNTATGTYELQAIDETTNTPSNSITEIVMSNPACVASTVNPKLWVDNKESSERKQGDENPFVLTGSGFTPNGTIRRFVRKPDGTQTEISQITADNNGNIPSGLWKWTPQCNDPTGTYEVWTVDARTEKQSNIVTEKVLPNPAKCPSEPGNGQQKVPVIFIPGILGTDLWLGQQRLWPDVACVGFLTDEYISLDSANGRSVTHGDVIRNYGQYPRCLGLIPHYGGFLKRLEQAGYQEHQTLFVFPYDWRRDLSGTARILDQQIKEVLKQTGSKQVDVIAHSMGGLVVRYYLNKIEPGSTKVRKLILAGVPNHGAPKAFKALVWGDPQGPWGITFKAETSRKLAQTFPSAYQLLPTRKFFELYHYIIKEFEGPLDGQGNSDKALNDTYSVIKAQSPHPDYVDRAKGFHNDMGDKFNFSGDTYIIAGIGQRTPGYWTYTCSPGVVPSFVVPIVIIPKQGCEWVEQFVEGDGTVPLGSALEISSLGDSVKICMAADHLDILTNTNGADTIVRILDSKEIKREVFATQCPGYGPNPGDDISKGDSTLAPPPTTKTIEQAIASLVPNDPPDVSNPDVIVGDVEMTRALGYYEKQEPVPNTGGKIIDDVTMLRLQDLWLSRRSVSSSSSLITSETSPRRKWGLLTRLLARHTVEFVALGFDVRSIRVEIFNLQGQRVFAEEAPNNRLTFRGQDSQGQRLANGVYLYVVTVRSHDGTIQRSSVRKLILQR
jgi:PKD repeat protein